MPMNALSTNSQLLLEGQKVFPYLEGLVVIENTIFLRIGLRKGKQDGHH